MQIAGIVGGIAPGSTVDYYRLLIERYRERQTDGSYPQVLINSIDLQRFLGLVSAGDRGTLTDYLLAELGRLARAGADFALFASNTPHLVFDDVRRQSFLPLISIVEATADAARVRGFRKLGLLGTRFTMEGGFYADVCARQGIAVVVPDPEDRAYVHERYFSELVNGVFRSETREGMLAVARRMQVSSGIDAIVLGGTELPLLFATAEPPDLPMLNTTSIHVERAVDWILQRG